MNETLKRTLSGAVYITLLISCILLSKESYYILFGAFLLNAAYEFSLLIHFNKLLAVVISFVTYAILYNTNYIQVNDAILTGLTIIVSLYLIYFLFNSKSNLPPSLLKYILLFGYIILPFIILTKIPYGVKGYNPKIIISIFILIWTNDTFAYLIGKSIGKHKLYKIVSPKKTIEGFIGGLVFTLLIGYLVAVYYTKAAINIWLVIAIIASVFGTIGDLIESKFKRIAGVKDSGKIMPGHGGVLDRLDSVIFVAPFVYLYYQILNFI